MTDTGKKLKVPFDLLIVFSTNLTQNDLVDDALLRRIRYKFEMQPPEIQFHDIWKMVCRVLNVPYDDRGLDYLCPNGTAARRPAAAHCQPRDLLLQMISIAKYNMETVHAQRRPDRRRQPDLLHQQREEELRGKGTARFLSA